MTPSVIKLPWSSCRGHLKQEYLVLNCLPDGGAYAIFYLWDWTISLGSTQIRGDADDYVFNNIQPRGGGHPSRSLKL